MYAWALLAEAVIFGLIVATGRAFFGTVDRDGDR